LLGCYGRQILKFVRLLRARGEPEFHLPLATAILQLKPHGGSRRQPRQLLVQIRVSRLTVDRGHPIADQDSLMLRLAVGIDLDYFWLAAQVCRGGEAGRRMLCCDHNNVQSSKLKEVVIRNFLDTGDVVAKEI